MLRHLKLIHGIDDRKGQNASNVSNTDTGMSSYGEVRTSNDSYGQHSRMTEKGRPMSEDYKQPTYEVSQLRMDGSHTEEK